MPLVVLDGDVHAGAAYLGTRPTFDNGAPVLETFLLDFDGDLYGRHIAIEFVAHLRADQQFAICRPWSPRWTWMSPQRAGASPPSPRTTRFAWPDGGRRVKPADCRAAPARL